MKPSSIRPKMPIIRRIMRIGDSRAICIPPSYFDAYERETGLKAEEVALEIDKVVTVSILPPRKENSIETLKVKA